MAFSNDEVDSAAGDPPIEPTRETRYHAALKERQASLRDVGGARGSVQGTVTEGSSSFNPTPRTLLQELDVYPHNVRITKEGTFIDGFCIGDLPQMPSAQAQRSGCQGRDLGRHFSNLPPRSTSSTVPSSLGGVSSNAGIQTENPIDPSIFSAGNGFKFDFQSSPPLFTKPFRSRAPDLVSFLHEPQQAHSATVKTEDILPRPPSVQPSSTYGDMNATPPSDAVTGSQAFSMRPPPMHGPPVDYTDKSMYDGNNGFNNPQPPSQKRKAMDQPTYGDNGRQKRTRPPRKEKGTSTERQMSNRENDINRMLGVLKTLGPGENAVEVMERKLSIKVGKGRRKVINELLKDEKISLNKAGNIVDINGTPIALPLNGPKRKYPVQDLNELIQSNGKHQNAQLGSESSTLLPNATRLLASITRMETLMNALEDRVVALESGTSARYLLSHAGFHGDNGYEDAADGLPQMYGDRPAYYGAPSGPRNPSELDDRTTDSSSNSAFQSIANAERNPIEDLLTTADGVPVSIAEDGRLETTPEVVDMAEAAIKAEGGLRNAVPMAEKDLLEFVPAAEQDKFVVYSKIDNKDLVKVEEQEVAMIH